MRSGQPYNEAGLLDIASELGILRKETIAWYIGSATAGNRLAHGTGPTRVDHLGSVLNGNLDDLVAGEISTNGGVLASLANDVGFVGLCNRGQQRAMARQLWFGIVL